MKERIIENWLDNASEISFQIPFCYMLANEGYKIIHITRHCAMEMGKDVIAISPNNVPCAYQLKSATGKRITLNEWNKNREQITSLIENAINHPSVSSDQVHESWFVTNKNLDEEVSIAINQMNQMNINRGRPEFQLKTIVRGELFEKAINLESNLWPTELENINLMLELIVGSGRSNLNKPKYCRLLESILPVGKQSQISRAECIRSITSSALICSLTLKRYEESKNNVALIEGWTIYTAYVLAVADRFQLPKGSWYSQLDIAFKVIFLALGRLCDELLERKNYFEGNPIIDYDFQRVRITTLVALMSIYGLWRKYDKIEHDEHDEFIKKFTIENSNKLLLWGEYCLPQFLAFYWYWRTINSSLAPEFLIRTLIDSICELKSQKSKMNFPDPYFDFEEINTADDIKHFSFNNYSYSLEGLVNIYVRSNWKQEMKLIWHKITRIGFVSFLTKKKWHYCLYKNREGTQFTKYPKLTKEWKELKDESFESQGKNMPKLIKEYPIFHLLFLFTFPHRSTAESVRWLDTKLFHNL